jgi:hypothetical protein
MENNINNNPQDSQTETRLTVENIRSLVKFLQRCTLSPSEIDEFLNLLKIIQYVSSNLK